MKKIAVIPARYAATRFPAKLLQMLGSKTVIRHTYENTVTTGLFDDVIVVTDNDAIYSEIASCGGNVIKSKKSHESGSDRIAEVVANMDVDIIVNVQGDEPFMEAKPLAALLNAFKDASIQVASLMHKISLDEEIHNPNIVKVVVDNEGCALYFSRSVIPYNRNTVASEDYFRHIGVYAYRKEALMHFIQWPIGRLENMEKLEQLRYLEHGFKIKMIETDKGSLGIDTPEDLELAKQFLTQLMG